MLTIRRADLSDLPTIVGNLKALAKLYGQRHDDVRIEAAVEVALTRLKARRWYCLAEAGNQHVGQICINSLWDDIRNEKIWHLGRLFVIPSARRSGVGSALLGHVRKEALQNGVFRLTCHIHEWNTPSQVLNERLGFRRNDDSVYYAELDTAVPFEAAELHCSAKPCDLISETNLLSAAADGVLQLTR